jgi:hypothetical protein
LKLGIMSICLCCRMLDLGLQTILVFPSGI